MYAMQHQGRWYIYSTLHAHQPGVPLARSDLLPQMPIAIIYPLDLATLFQPASPFRSEAHTRLAGSRPLGHDFAAFTMHLEQGSDTVSPRLCRTRSAFDFEFITFVT